MASVVRVTLVRNCKYNGGNEVKREIEFLLSKNEM